MTSVQHDTLLDDATRKFDALENRADKLRTEVAHIEHEAQYIRDLIERAITGRGAAAELRAVLAGDE